MQGEMPFYETPEQALEACVQALGGAKKVGPMLWPDKGIDNARTYLLACLNSERAEKLSYSQILFLFRESKQAGFHTGFNYWAQECEYDARPITKAEELDRLTSVIETSSKTLALAIQTLDRLKKAG